MNLQQKTIKKKLVLEGIALHSGALVKIALIPSEENTGIIFLKKIQSSKRVGKILFQPVYVQKFLINMEQVSVLLSI